MATKQQKARARADVEAGKRIVLHATKFNVKQKQRLKAARIETSLRLVDFLRDQESLVLWSMTHYTVDETTHVIYVRDGGNTHTVYVNYPKQTLTVYEDTSLGGSVTVCRDLDQLVEALSAIC